MLVAKRVSPLSYGKEFSTVPKMRRLRLDSTTLQGKFFATWIFHSPPLNDVAHRAPGKIAGNFPFHPHNSKGIPKHKLLVKYLPGICGGILEPPKNECSKMTKHMISMERNERKHILIKCE